jgi:hypothetical protein
MHMRDTRPAPEWRSQLEPQRHFSAQDWLLMLLLTLYLIFVAIWLFADASLVQILAPLLPERDSGWRDWLFASVNSQMAKKIR